MIINILLILNIVPNKVDIKIYDSNNNLKKVDDYIATSDKIVKSINDLSKTYYLIVDADVSKDGIIKSNDALLIDKYLVKTYNFDEYQLKAADISKDLKIATNDSLYIKRFLVGLMEL